MTATITFRHVKAAILTQSYSNSGLTGLPCRPVPPAAGQPTAKFSCLMQTNQEETLFPRCARVQPPGQGTVTPINTAGKAINTGMQPEAIAISGSQASPFEQAVQDGRVGARHVH
jgi:hypothetical protein